MLSHSVVVPLLLQSFKPSNVESTTARQILEFCMCPILKNSFGCSAIYEAALRYTGATNSRGVWQPFSLQPTANIPLCTLLNNNCNRHQVMSITHSQSLCHVSVTTDHLLGDCYNTIMQIYKGFTFVTHQMFKSH
jgi:hypothetical protein